MFIVNDPGPWQYYVNRIDNKGLPLMEVKDKYLREQLLFEQYISFQMQQQMLMQQNTSGGGRFPSIIEDDTINEFVDNDYVENYFL
jgi:hypothetical protein